MRTVLVPLLIFAAVAVWFVVRDSQEQAARITEKAAAERAQAQVDPQAVRRLKAMQAEPTPGIGDRPQRPGTARRAPVGPADIEHAHAGLSLMLDHCFSALRQRTPEAKGHIKLAFTLVKKGGYGTVEALRVLEEPFGDAALRTCLLAGPTESFPVPDGDGRMDATLGFDLPLNGGTE